MRHRMFAALLSILLAVSLLLSYPTTAKADNWTAVMEQYDKLFKSADYERLYTSLILDPETFVNQLAFRDAETKSEVMLCLTDPRITPEQIRNMTQVVERVCSLDLDRTASETQLLNVMYEYFVCTTYQNLGIVTDFDELMNWFKTADPAGGFNELAFELACAVMGAPKDFLSQLAKEEEAVQDWVMELLQIHNGTYIATAVVDRINRSEAVYIAETSGLAHRICTTLNCKLIPVPSNPDPIEYEKWLTSPHANHTITVDYGLLFSKKNGNDLRIVLLKDTRNFVKNLAYQDAKTKQEVFDALTDNYFEDSGILQMYLHLQQYLQYNVLNKSQTALVEALMYHLDDTYCSQGHPYRDISVLFNTSPDESDVTSRFYTFRRELKLAFLADPYAFLFMLEKEDASRQEYVIRGLMFTEDNNDALIRHVYSQWIQEENADYYTEEQHELIRQVTVSYLPILGETPKPSDPDPEEYEKWLEEQGLLTDDPGMTLPIYPDQSDPAESAATEETKPADTSEKDTGWVSTVCFMLGFLCIGIATGSIIAKKKRSKKAAQAEKQAAAEVPVKIYPKLLYCPAPLSRETQKQITLALREKYDEYSVHWYSIKETDGTCRCYGTDNGYDIIFYAGGLRMEIPDSHTIGDMTFHFGTGFELYAHKDGQLIDLNTALAQGFVSLQAVQEALNKHKSITK